MLFTIIFFYLFCAGISPEITCDPELKNTFAMIQKVKSAEELIEEALKEGPIKIKNDTNFPFEAYWDTTTRTIGVTSVGSKIHSILFELQNASAQKYFDYYNTLAMQKKIGRDEYVRAIEHIEYQNTRKTASIIDEGIRQGLFPEESQPYYYSNFEEHLCHQQSTGHSAWIAEIYDGLCS